MTTPWPQPWPEHLDHLAAEQPEPAPFGLRGTLAAFGTALLLGVVLALVWWLLAPAAREASEPNELAVASDTALVVLSALTGLAQGTLLVIRGGVLSLARVVVTFVAACVGAVIATVLGLWLGAAAALGIVGAALSWPIAFLVVVGFAEALRYALSREH